MITGSKNHFEEDIAKERTFFSGSNETPQLLNVDLSSHQIKKVLVLPNFMKSKVPGLNLNTFQTQDNMVKHNSHGMRNENADHITKSIVMFPNMINIKTPRSETKTEESQMHNDSIQPTNEKDHRLLKPQILPNIMKSITELAPEKEAEKPKLKIIPKFGIKPKLLPPSIEKEQIVDCANSQHSGLNSPYSRDEIPNKYTKLEPENHSAKEGWYCRNSGKENYKKCTGASHNTSGSPFKKNMVPENFFKLNPEDDTQSKTYKTCYHCRQTDQIRLRARENGKKLLKKSLMVNSPDIGFCNCPSHDTASKHARSRVPLELFYKIKGDPKSYLCSFCRDCREYINNMVAKKKERKDEENKALGIYVCPGCRTDTKEDERAFQKDGKTLSCLCKPCYLKKKERDEILKKEFEDLKFEKMLEIQCGCNSCNKIFLKPASNSLVVPTLETYKKEGSDIKYVEYEGKEYLATDFLVNFRNLLELMYVIHFDHLTEKEQRDRGLLQPHEEFIPKKNLVRSLNSTAARKREALKTQLLCAICHVDATISREKGNNRDSKIRIQKRAYVDSIKLQGCSSCGWKSNVPRHFDLDHKDPSSKLACVAQMAHRYPYTLQDVIAETDKCRTLCKLCHAINTKNQIEEELNFEDE